MLHDVTGWEGEFCELDVDGCASFDCFMGVACTDVTAPGVGAQCAGCPSGYRGDGAKCAGKNTQHSFNKGHLDTTEV